MNYLKIPQYRIKFDDVTTDGLIDGEITLTENAYWTATLTFQNATTIYPSSVDKGSTVLVEVHDADSDSPWNSGNYVTLFNGTVLYPNILFDNNTAFVVLNCVGLGYALNMMNCAEEYGLQSRNPARDSIQSILTNATVGIIPKYVNKYKNTAYDSGYSIDTTYVENLAGSIPYIVAPWKPVDKFLDDLCDLHTSISQESSLAGPHWIVDHDGYLRLKRIGVSQTGWTKYYGNSQASATLENGVDLFDGDFQSIAKQANVVVMYGAWRRPSSGDAWTNPANNTEAQATWLAMNDSVDYFSTVTSDTTNNVVDTSCVRLTQPLDYTGVVEMRYPYTQDAAWDLTLFELTNTPNIKFNAFTYDVAPEFGPLILLCTDNENYFYLNLSTADTWAGVAKATSLITENGKPMAISLPVGPNSSLVNDGKVNWQTQGSPNWGEINYIAFQIFAPKQNSYLCIDGLHFGDANICRIARQEFPDEVSAGRGTLGESTNPIRFKTITDNVGKDDSLVADDDTGTMAQLTKAELLRLVSEPTIGKFYTPLIPDILPGQYFYIAKDWRIQKLVHKLGEATTHFEVTDDVLNSHARPRYENINRRFAAMRPEWQDRQASSIKSGIIDIRVTPLEKAYNV